MAISSSAPNVLKNPAPRPVPCPALVTYRHASGSRQTGSLRQGDIQPNPKDAQLLGVAEGPETPNTPPPPAPSRGQRALLCSWSERSTARGSTGGAFFGSGGEAAAPALGLPLPTCAAGKRVTPLLQKPAGTGDRIPVPQRAAPGARSRRRVHPRGKPLQKVRDTTARRAAAPRRPSGLLRPAASAERLLRGRRRTPARGSGRPAGGRPGRALRPQPKSPPRPGGKRRGLVAPLRRPRLQRAPPPGGLRAPLGRAGGGRRRGQRGRGGPLRRRVPPPTGSPLRLARRPRVGGKGARSL